MKYVSRLRAALGETAIATVGSGYRLQLNGHGYDVDEFEAVVGRRRTGDLPDVAVARYDEALGLWRGPAVRRVRRRVVGAARGAPARRAASRRRRSPERSR